MTTLTLDRHKGRAITYYVVLPGLNYRIDEMRAALGLVQFENLKHANQQRQQIVEKYRQELATVEGLSMLFADEQDRVSTYHIFPVLLPVACDRVKVIELLKQEGVQSSIHYLVFQGFSAYKNTLLDQTPIANEISKRELTLPLYPTMTLEETDIVIAALRKALSVAKEG